MCSCDSSTYNTSRIVLVGVKHAGKSSVGKILASLVNLPFIDGDDLILKIAQNYHYVNNTTHTIRELYSILGTNVFRKVEQESLKSLRSHYVYAAGGGIADCAHAWTILQDACIILLDVSIDLAWKRICVSSKRTGTMPAFLQNKENPLQYFRTLYQIRRAVYASHAHIVYDANTKSPRDIASDITNEISQTS